jgi:inositol-phosphate phosphatase/L-galactose 1-phosphate phosphatase/histidinol-phosphatase
MTSSPPTTELVTFANTLADTARRIILPHWRQPIAIESKLEHDRPIAESPVTIADRNTEQAMRQLIESTYPTHGIYGEEFGHVRMDAEYIWVLDPIDGTKSFITGKPLFGTLIACLRDGVPIIGVIDQCVLDERWVGVVGEGTTLNGKPVKTCGCEELKESMMYATTPHMFGTGEEEEKFKAMCEVVKRPLYGADCYAYAIVASGFGADVVVEADLGLYDVSVT